ncbi:hypothetical protein E4656_09445 [Natronospirillum operosum]|uniref:SPOR domain-containing protein n=1 Tax=Natronospirillum operosum TaxID=2759953 RepID=A0A4Z0WDJ1_9GAMM|nr:SPOR domain-containing protein [Natronospirillum operosum]TGG93272.1 hypothetical protein E4656_09445 [Natronospirillum operosum]
MPRDYAQKPQPGRAPQQSRVPRWVWLFTTSVVVLFVGGLFFLSQLPEDGEPMQIELPSLSGLFPAPSQSTTEPAPSSTAPPAETPSVSRQAQLEFYTLLQQTDVFVPDEVVALRQREVIEEAATDLLSDRIPDAPADSSTESPGQFIIQVASFSAETDANNLRAQLILEGLTSAHVTQADLGERGIFYRVLVGPVDSTQETQRIGDRLDSLGMQGLVRNHTP